jgi:hypothetical protein
LALIIAGVFIAFGSTHKPPPKPPEIPFPTAFEDLKADKLASAEPIPKVVKVVPVARAKPILDEAPKDEIPKDVCERDGGRKITFYRRHHEGWRCVYPRRRR